LSEVTIDTLKKLKLKELDEACNKAILENFKAVINNTTYFFSNDIFAQSNFSSTKLGFMDGSIDTYMGGVVPWTCYNADGAVVRLQLNKEMFDIVFMARLQYVQDNVSRLRDTLEPKVDEATTEEQLNTIIW
jgi:hypothetical protein